MPIRYLNSFKKILYTPVPAIKPSDAIFSGFKIILVFAAFYFAIFQFNAPWERIKLDIFEFFSVGFSLYCSCLIFWLITDVYSKKKGKRLFQTFGTGFVGFLIIYTLMIGIHYLIKESTYSSGKSWVWGYYWRHLPYAFLICCVFYYRETKKEIIENLVQKLNLKLEDHEKDDIKHEDTGESESVICLQVDGGTRKLQSSCISHVCVDGHYLDIYYHKQPSTEHFLVRKSLTEMLEDLPSPPFLRIHRTHIVNLDYISEIKKVKRQYWVVLLDKEFSLPISRSHLTNLLSNLEKPV